MRLLIYNRAPFPIEKYRIQIYENGDCIECKVLDDFFEFMEYARDKEITGVINADHVIKKESLALMYFDTHPEVKDYESAIDIINEIQWEINDFYFGESIYYNSEREIIEDYFGTFNIDYLAPFIV